VKAGADQRWATHTGAGNYESSLPNRWHIFGRVEGILEAIPGTSPKQVIAFDVGLFDKLTLLLWW
jgi:hypothetical protein